MNVPRKPSQPHPRITFVTLIALVLALIVFVAAMAASRSTQGFLRPPMTGGLVPATFVFVAVLVGVVVVALFIRRKR